MADNKVLFVSDLDGTLMRSDISLSDFTVRTINGLVENGLNFTYATARSVESARPIAGGLNLKLPVITRNGAVLADNNTGRHIEKSVFTSDEVQLLKDMLEELPLCGFVSCFTGEKMIKTYMAGEHTEAFQGYIDYNKDDPVMVSKSSVEEMFCGEPGYVTLMGEKEYIRPIYEKVKTYQGWESLFQKDTYREEYWLEICPQNCTKAKSILKLKEQLGFEKLVVFGDSLNDISMFKIADESYAVANAMDELKKIATYIIGSNEEDSVVDLLKERFNNPSL
jgi:Cof subfamily protein (haloacid dehalogenase superfamily)